MDNNTEFHSKKHIIDELYNAGLITGFEWYKALSILLEQYDLEKEINSV